MSVNGGISEAPTANNDILRFGAENEAIFTVSLSEPFAEPPPPARPRGWWTRTRPCPCTARLVEDGSALKVFEYTLAGGLLGSWAIDPADAHPTGIAVNPANVSDVWIVDGPGAAPAARDRVCSYGVRIELP